MQGFFALGVPVILGVVVLALFIIVSMMFRTVVETNKVHIVQSKKKTTSYGTGHADGNVYYKWPSWVPMIGVNSIILPVSNFDHKLDGYKSYDKDRVPFELDLMAFFRIADTNKAAERVDNIATLMDQLQSIVKGAARKILSSHDIHTIMTDRATFGQQFTDEVKAELENWGVEPVKNMELMDIRDTEGSNVISAIMAKKSSHIEMESRVEVANNMQAAETAEIEAQRTIDISKQAAEQQVGERTAAKEKAVGIANEQAQQEVKAEAAKTAARAVEVNRVEQVGQADIDKAKAIVTGEQEKEVAILNAEGKLEATKRDAEGVQVQGAAKAEAEKLILLAPVEAQIKLAQEIGSNEGYMTYLLGLKSVEGYISVGGEQAKALAAADIKVIANAGSPGEGLTSAMQLFSANGGLSIGGMLESFSNTPQGADLLESLKKRLAGKPVTAPTAPVEASEEDAAE